MQYRMTPAEVWAMKQWQGKIDRLSKEVDAYNARKPFTRAKDSREQKNRLNALRAYHEIIENIQKPPAERDPVAQYDIESRIKYYMPEA